MLKSTGSASSASSDDVLAVKSYLVDLHDRITSAVEKIDSVPFHRDAWQRAEGGGGRSRRAKATGPGI